MDVLGSAGKYGNPEERKSTLPAKPSFSHFFWAHGPRGFFFFDVLGSDGKYGNPEETKSTLPAKPSFSHFFFGPMGLGETLANFFWRFWEVMGSPWKSTHTRKTNVF